MKKRITVKQAAELTGYHIQTIYKFMKDGLMPNRRTRSGGRYLYEEDLVKFLEPEPVRVFDAKRWALEAIAAAEARGKAREQKRQKKT